MVDLPLARGDYFRGVAKEARIRIRNRYFETNPVLSANQVALLGRMGMRRFVQVGEGPIRAVYSQAGTFDDDLFVVSYDTLYRVSKTDGTVTTILSGMTGTSLRSVVKMAATANIGETPAFLFIADGAVLYVYMENSYARGTYGGGTPANLDKIVIGGTESYAFTSGSVDAGAPAGTVANPWLVKVGATPTESFLNLFNAINATGVPGVDYSTAKTAPSEQIQALAYTAAQLQVRAIDLGALGNAITTTAPVGTNAWGAATLTGGGGTTINQVQTPDDIGVMDVGYIASHVVVIPSQDQGVNGQYYWIEPGEMTIDPLNFATAERAPDPIYGVVVFGDQFWLPGQTTTEVWYFTGDIDAPVSRLQGVVFDRGTWAGTALQVKDSMIIVDNDGGVFQISGGIKRISRPDIEEQIREAIQYQTAHPL